MNKYFFCFLTFMLAGFVAKAQYQYLNDPQGRPYMQHSYTEVEGTPFLITNWATGSVVLDKGQISKTQLKYDLVADELLFQNKSDSSAMAFVDRVKSFSLNDVSIEESDLTPLVFGNGYPAVDNQTSASFYQVIADGKMKL